MDLEKLRQARLQRYSGVTSTIVNDADISAGETASAGGNVEEAEPTQAVVSELVYSSLVPSSNDVIAGTLTEIRDLLLQLPANIAAALAGSIPAAVQSVSAAAPSPAPLQATVAASLQVPHTAPPPLQAPVAASLQVPAPPPLQPPAAPLPSLQGAMQIAPQPSNDSEPDEPYPVEDSQVDLFSAPGTEADACGVCHMPIKGHQFAFDGCGHYPFCVNCVEQVKSQSAPLQCPYCKTAGNPLKLTFEE